jgi:hypothetical protein
LAAGSLLAGLLTGCNSYAQWAQRRWYEQTAARILDQARLQPDSVGLAFSADSTRRTESLYAAGKLFRRRFYDQQILRAEFYYAQTNDFELRRELCEEGGCAFEGIFVADQAYGLSTWWDCNRQLRKRGVRYGGEPVGEWAVREPGQNGTRYLDYGQVRLLLAMPEFVE